MLRTMLCIVIGFISRALVGAVTKLALKSRKMNSFPPVIKNDKIAEISA